MRHALIGHTGFVGSNLDRQHRFTDRYNSANITDIRGERFDLVVCAGVSAVKWKTNKDPEADKRGIDALLGPLAEADADRVVLISTVDVYPSPIGVDEDAPIDPDANHAYGAHRYAVEEFVRQRYATHHVLRLPGLFGDGLKKNVIFDLLHDNGVDRIDPAASFQWYPLDRLWGDIETAITNDLRTANLATEPVATAEIIEEFFPDKTGDVAAPSDAPARYDFRTKHAETFGGKDGYAMSRDEVLAAIGDFIERERGAA